VDLTIDLMSMHNIMGKNSNSFLAFGIVCIMRTNYQGAMNSSFFSQVAVLFTNRLHNVFVACLFVVEAWLCDFGSNSASNFAAPWHLLVCGEDAYRSLVFYVILLVKSVTLWRLRSFHLTAQEFISFLLVRRGERLPLVLG